MFDNKGLLWRKKSALNLQEIQGTTGWIFLPEISSWVDRTESSVSLRDVRLESLNNSLGKP